MKSLELRQKFFEFFKKNGHAIVPSSPLIPAQDPTLLFANAGMNQFKDVFLGTEKRSYNRAVSIQKCIRAGGKHNDLENVGFTKRHLTFFEMMGNFSFGDYFKKEAITYAWDFLTKEVKLPVELLYATVYKNDDESYELWHSITGLPYERIVRLGEADNFWQMGDTGPCGPCSEIYIDRGVGYGCGKSLCAPGCSCDRFLEIWNLVFMQFNRQPDGTDLPLKKTGVDTGMGLERLCAVVQQKDSVYETDLFMPLIHETERLTGINYETATPEIQAAFRVLADHVRSTSFAIADGCTPSNEGRGYVLRKIIRRAALFAQKLTNTNIFPQLSQKVVTEFGALYPELMASKKLIFELLTSEIEKFSLNLVNGQAILDQYIQRASGKQITGQEAFKLYDTYGFPLELTKVIAQEKGFDVDVRGFETAMTLQKEQSGKKQQATVTVTVPDQLTTEFTGYTELITPTIITGLILDNKLVTTVPQGELCYVITEKSPLYVECGGQINDSGLAVFGHAKAAVLDIKKLNHAIAFSCVSPIELTLEQPVTLEVERDVRLATMRNHTATHLLQAALQCVLGKHIKQAGSLVTPGYLRFDFSHHASLTGEEIAAIEKIVNEKILENITLAITQTNYKDAVERGVIAFFGEKYNPDNVRVVAIPGFSAELCGGTHVRATGDIGIFKITENSALSAGTRRIVAITGFGALVEFQKSFNLIKSLGLEYKTHAEGLLPLITQQKAALQESQKAHRATQRLLFEAHVPALIERARKENSSLVYTELSHIPAGELKEYAELVLKHFTGVVTLVSKQAQDYAAYITVSPQLHGRVSLSGATELLRSLGGKGGGTDKHVQGTLKELTPEFESGIKKLFVS